MTMQIFTLNCMLTKLRCPYSSLFYALFVDAISDMNHFLLRFCHDNISCLTEFESVWFFGYLNCALLLTLLFYAFIWIVIVHWEQHESADDFSISL
jgi:hypothetical protein